MHPCTGSSAMHCLKISHLFSLTLNLWKEKSHTVCSHQSSLTGSIKTATFSGLHNYSRGKFWILDTFPRISSITLSGVDTPELIPSFRCPVVGILSVVSCNSGENASRQFYSPQCQSGQCSVTKRKRFLHYTLRNLPT